MYSVTVPAKTKHFYRKENVKVLLLKNDVMVKIIITQRDKEKGRKDLADEYLESIVSLSKGHKILNSGMQSNGNDSCYNYLVAHRMGQTGMEVSSWYVFEGEKYNYIITYMGNYKFYEKDKKSLDYIVRNFKILK